RLLPPAMGRAGLEHAVHRVLQISRRRHDGRVDAVPRLGSGTGAACEGRIVIETVLIAAVADNGVIGAGGAIPWRLKSDMQRLKAMTMGKPVVMGRKTFQSLRKPLPGRTNIVLTRDAGFRADGAGVTNSLGAAAWGRQADALRRSVAEIAGIGGADIYAQWMDMADRLEVTEVHAEVEGDTRFSRIDAAQWEEVARERHAAGGDDSADFSYVTY